MDDYLINGKRTDEQSIGGKVDVTDDITLAEPPPILSRSFKGRYGRLNFVRDGNFLLLGYALVFLLAVLATGVANIGLISKLISAVLAFVGVVVLTFLSIRASVLRLHDINLSGWLILLTLIPPASVVFCIIFYFVSGSKGVNKYGLPTRSGSKWHLMLSILASALIVYAALSGRL